MKACFHSHFYAIFHASVTSNFDLIFMKFSPKCRTKKLGMITPFWEVFALLNWERAIIRPQIRPRKIPVSSLPHCVTEPGRSSQMLDTIKYNGSLIFVLRILQ